MRTDRYVRQLATRSSFLLALGLTACSSDTKPTDTADTGTESTPSTVEHTGEYTGCRGGATATDSGGSGGVSDSGGSGSTDAPARAHTGGGC